MLKPNIIVIHLSDSYKSIHNFTYSYVELNLECYSISFAQAYHRVSKTYLEYILVLSNSHVTIFFFRPWMVSLQHAKKILRLPRLSFLRLNSYTDELNFLPSSSRTKKNISLIDGRRPLPRTLSQTSLNLGLRLNQKIKNSCSFNHIFKLLYFILIPRQRSSPNQSPFRITQQLVTGQLPYLVDNLPLQFILLVSSTLLGVGLCDCIPYVLSIFQQEIVLLISCCMKCNSQDITIELLHLRFQILDQMSLVQKKCQENNSI